MQIKEIAQQMKALGNVRRLQIIKFLQRKKGATVSDIAEFLRLSEQSTSKHLQRLSAVDIIKSKRRGMNVVYRMSLALPPAVKDILRRL